MREKEDPFPEFWIRGVIQQVLQVRQPSLLSHKAGIVKVRLGLAGLIFNACSLITQVELGKVKLGKVRPDQALLDKSGPGKARLGQVRLGRGLVKVRLGLARLDKDRKGFNACSLIT
jgi:hypothetical protein